MKYLYMKLKIYDEKLIWENISLNLIFSLKKLLIIWEYNDLINENLIHSWNERKKFFREKENLINESLWFEKTNNDCINIEEHE